MDQRPFRTLPRWLLAAGVVLALSGWLDAHAGKSLYTYADDQGNMVATDRLEDIPPRYRDRVKVIEDAGGTPVLRELVSEPVKSISQSKEQVVYAVIARLPARVIPGLSTYQSVMLIVGFLAMMAFYAAGKLTRGPFWQLLMPWAIGITVVLTMYFMFISDLSNQVAARYPGKSTGSLINTFQRKSKNISEQKQHRLKQFDQRTESDS